MDIHYYPYEIKHLNILRTLAPECTVLLKSDGSFPLKYADKIALYGNGGRLTLKGGTGSGDVYSRHVVSVEEGLEKAGFEITTKKWLNAYTDVRISARKTFVEQIKAKAKVLGIPPILLGMGAIMPEPDYDFAIDGKGETCIYVLSRVTGEGADRKAEKGDIFLSDTEIRDILACSEKYKNFMLVLNVGGMIDLTPVLSVQNILVLSQLGALTGDILADILLGKSYPSGKLTSTWTKWEDYPALDFGNADDTRYKEGIYVGYRYFDSVKKQPLFPFGFGLGYTNFSYSVKEITHKKDTIYLTVTVRNIGNYKGKEILQLYVSAPMGKFDKPYQELAAYVKTNELAADEEENVTLSFRLSDMTSFDTENSSYILEQGNYVLRLGTDSKKTVPIAVFALTDFVTVKKVKNVCPIPDYTDEKYSLNEKEDLISVPHFSLTANDFTTQTVDYTKPFTVNEKIEKFSESELAYLCIGNFISKKENSVIGNASVTVAGAAGETTHNVNGIPSIVFADGPAGLRISRQYGRDERGIYRIGDDFPPEIMDFVDDRVRAFLGLKNETDRNGTIHDQYCTAIPIGTAIAQSWNLELCKEFGKIVGDEMQRFGVHLWLAPALNIHRSPLCGRNYEYYSEDPLISGKTAAYITLGVQSYNGCGVTVKHYACNNQETNRYTSNSILSERALREIYLKGFEIVLKESSPCAVMTSYNLLNGVHTSEHKELLNDVLRYEFGFDGLVMSDWITSSTGKNTKYPIAHAATSIKAGNDLFMPGCDTDFDDVLTSLENGNISLKDLRICASRVYETIKKLKK